MSDVYSEKSYGADEVGFGEKLGILVVDFQKSFTDPVSYTHLTLPTIPLV